MFGLWQDTGLFALEEDVERVTATVVFALQDLRHAETVGDITDIAARRNVASYAAAGTVQAPEIRVNGVAQANSYVLSDGEIVTQYVADDAGSTPFQTTIGNVVHVDPVNTVAPAIAGNTQLGDTLTSDTGTWTGEDLTFEYQWVSDGVPIDGEENATLTISVEDADAVIECDVTASNSGADVTASSNQVTLGDLLPANTVAPAVSGSTGLGDTLSATTGTWTGNGISYAYQWRNAGVDIPGETGATYDIVLADSLDGITCLVTATNAAGSVSQISNSVTVDDLSGSISQDRVIASWHHSLWNNGQTDEVVPYWMDRIADADGGKTIQARGQTGFQGRDRVYDPTVGGEHDMWTDGWIGVTFPGDAVMTTWAQVDSCGVNTLVYLTDNFQGPPAGGSTETNPTVGGNIPDGTSPADTYVNNSGTSHLSDVFIDHEAALDALGSRTSPTADFLINENLPEAATYFATPGAANAQTFSDWLDNIEGDNATWYSNLETVVKTRVGATLAPKVKLVPVATAFASVCRNTPASAMTASDWFSDSAPHGNAVTYLFYAMVYHSFLFEEAAPQPDFTGSTIPAVFTSNYATIAAHILDFINGTLAVDAFVANAVADQSFTQGTGVQTLDVSNVFGGVPAPTVTLLTSTTGVTLSGSTLSIDTGATGLLSGETITLQGSNAGATVTDSFALDVVVANVAPTVANAIADQSYTSDTGVQTIAAGSVFSGTPTPTLSLVSPPTGVTIAGTTISIDTATTGALSAVSITVRATNSEGTADDVFLLDVTAASVSRVSATGTQYISGFMADADVDRLEIAFYGIDLTEVAGNGNLLFFKDTSGAPDSTVILRDNGSDGAIMFNAGNFVKADTPLPVGVFDLRFVQDVNGDGGTRYSFLQIDTGSGWTDVAGSVSTASITAQNPRDLVLLAGESGAGPLTCTLEGIAVVADGVTVLDLNPGTATLFNSGTDLDANSFTATGTFVAV